MHCTERKEMKTSVVGSSLASRTTRAATGGSAAIMCLIFAATLVGSTYAGQEETMTNSTSVALALDSRTEVVLKKDINGMPAGTRVISTPSFYEYSLAPVVDGIEKRNRLGWKECSWASEEDGAVHGIEIQFSKPQYSGRFQVTWAYDVHNGDNGKWWVSRNYVIQVKEKAADAWKTVVAVQNNQSSVGSYPLPREAIGYLRIYQPAMGGHLSRPNIMWVGQIALTE
jgi:hypothetical protein